MDQQFNPFQSPKLAPPAAPTAAPMNWIMPFESGHARAKWAMTLLAIMALLSVAAVAVGYTGHQRALEQGSPVTIHEPEGIAGAAVGGLQFVVWVGTVIAFCLWTHRVSRNLPALGGRGLKYTPGWAVGWYFIPVANFVVPIFVMREIWRESDPAQRHLDSQGGKSASPLVAWWWGTYAIRWILSLAAMVVGGIIGGMVAAKAVSNPRARPEELTASMGNMFHWVDWLAIANNGLAFVAAILAILVVRCIDKNQQAKYDLILNEPTAI